MRHAALLSAITCAIRSARDDGTAATLACHEDVRDLAVKVDQLSAEVAALADVTRAVLMARTTPQAERVATARAVAPKLRSPNDDPKEKP